MAWVAPLEFHHNVWLQKNYMQSSWAVARRSLRDGMFSRFDRTATRDGQTNRRTDRQTERQRDRYRAIVYSALAQRPGVKMQQRGLGLGLKVNAATFEGRTP